MILNHPLIRSLFSLIKIIFGTSFLGIVILNYFVNENPPNIFLFVFGIIAGIFLGFNLLYFSMKSILKKDK